MKQGRKLVSLCAALAMLAVVAPIAHAAKAKAPAVTGAKASRSMHQFTGIVTALDKSTLTVEKHGKKPKTMVFVKHDAMSSTGDLEKDARVTVYYREEGGRTVAHRVVVKPQATAAAE